MQARRAELEVSCMSLQGRVKELEEELKTAKGRGACSYGGEYGGEGRGGGDRAAELEEEVARMRRESEAVEDKVRVLLKAVAEQLPGRADADVYDKSARQGRADADVYDWMSLHGLGSMYQVSEVGGGEGGGKVGGMVSYGGGADYITHITYGMHGSYGLAGDGMGGGEAGKVGRAASAGGWEETQREVDMASLGLYAGSEARAFSGGYGSGVEQAGRRNHALREVVERDGEMAGLARSWHVLGDVVMSASDGGAAYITGEGTGRRLRGSGGVVGVD